MERAYAVRPSQAEDRIEVLMACAAWRDDAGKRHLLAMMREIKRSPSGAYAGLTPIDDMPSASELMAGWLRDVVPPVDVSPQDRETVKRNLGKMGIGLRFETMPSVH